MRTPQTQWTAIIMAAGQGKRMRSETPKVLHPVCGKPMLAYPVQAALDAGAPHVVVVIGHKRDDVQNAIIKRFAERCIIAYQKEPRGTGDAVAAGLSLCGNTESIVILSGDVPGIDASALRALLASKEAGAAIAMLTATTSNPHGYGRIVRDGSGQVIAIREDRDCSELEQSIQEINPAIYCFDTDFLKKHITLLQPHNTQRELYLTDLVNIAVQKRLKVTTQAWPMPPLQGVNDRVDLATVEATILDRIRRHWMQVGVTMHDPGSIYIEDTVELAPDVVLYPGVSLRGMTRVASGARIANGCVLTHTHVGSNAELLPYCVVTDSHIGAECRIGPFAHLRPGTVLAEEVHIGNFVETKKTRMARGSKANHLSYLGDGEIGARVNIGAGTIFCNYDGVEKHLTAIEEDVFVGSDSQLVAPLRIGRGAYIGSGTTVTRDIPAQALALSRAKLEIKEGFAEKLRGRKKKGS